MKTEMTLDKAEAQLRITRYIDSLSSFAEWSYASDYNAFTIRNGLSIARMDHSEVDPYRRAQIRRAINLWQKA